jgi:hypothetical protein
VPVPAPRRTVTARATLTAISLGVALTVPAVFWDQGCFEREATTFVQQYRKPDGRSLPQKVFDPHGNDLGTYQARELSYLLDFADAHALPHLSAPLGAAFSIPLSALLATLIWVVAFHALAHRWAPHAGATISTLLLICFVTSFCFVSTMGFFYRSAKPVLAALVVVWLAALLAARRARSLAAARLWTGAIGLISLGAGLLDRQGAFMVTAAAVLLWLHHRRTGELGQAWRITAIVAVSLQVYNFLLGPAIVQTLNGYRPDFSYQQVPLIELARLPNHLLRAAALLVQNLLLVFGGNWLVVTLLGVLAAGWLWRRRARWAAVSWRQMREYGRSGRHGRLVEYGWWILLSQLVMFALMIARHGYVYRWVDHRYWYYPIPFLALALCGLLLALDAWSETASARQRSGVAIGLAVLAVSNLLSLDSRRDVMLSGQWFGDIYPQCQLLKTSLRSGTPAPGLAPEYLALYEHLTATAAGDHQITR